MSKSEEHRSDDRDNTREMSPGEYLQQIRKEKELSVEVVSEATKISIKNIRAIEEANYEVLPADTFVRGLVTLYCNFLAIDGSKIAAEFLARRESSTPPVSGRRIRAAKHLHSASLAPKKLAEPAHISSATIALILLAVIIFSFTGFCLYTSWNPFSFLSQQTESIQTSMHQVFGGGEQEEVEEAPGMPTQTAAGTATAEQQHSYALSAFFLKDSKVEVRIDAHPSRQETFKNGQMADWHATRSLQVIFDQPDAAILKLNENPLPFPKPSLGQRPTLLLPDDLRE